jgi:hypothetical protein
VTSSLGPRIDDTGIISDNGDVIHVIYSRTTQATKKVQRRRSNNEAKKNEEQLRHKTVAPQPAQLSRLWQNTYIVALYQKPMSGLETNKNPIYSSYLMTHFSLLHLVQVNQVKSIPW